MLRVHLFHLLKITNFRKAQNLMYLMPLTWLCVLLLTGWFREEAGVSWGGDNAHQKRRRWKAPSEEEASKKSSSQTSTSSPLFSFFPRDRWVRLQQNNSRSIKGPFYIILSFPFFSPACDNLELQRRYPHLHAPLSLFHMQLCWPESFPPSQPLPLAGPCHFHVGSQQPKTELTPSPDPIDNSTFSVKVM